MDPAWWAEHQARVAATKSAPSGGPAPRPPAAKSAIVKTKHQSRLEVSVPIPYCGCGELVKKHLVKKYGPNYGRPYYACPNRLKTETKVGCDYFAYIQ